MNHPNVVSADRHSEDGVLGYFAGEQVVEVEVTYELQIIYLVDFDAGYVGLWPVVLRKAPSNYQSFGT